MLGLLRCPRLDVVCRGSCPSIRLCELINLRAAHGKKNASTLPISHHTTFECFHHLHREYSHPNTHHAISTRVARMTDTYQDETTTPPSWRKPSPECIYDNLALHRLDWVHHHSHCSLIQGFKALHSAQHLSDTTASVVLPVLPSRSHKDVLLDSFASLFSMAKTQASTWCSGVRC